MTISSGYGKIKVHSAGVVALRKEETDMSNEERILFKEKKKKKEYTVLVKELLNAIDMGEDVLKKFLLGCENPALYSSHGTYQEEGHDHCGGLKGNRFTEKRFCKCLYYRNGKYYNSEECRECDFADRFDITGNYRITDYEVPAYFYGKGIGEIDLIISDGKTQYATELKPYKGNEETLLRMIAEIMTYTIGYPTGKYIKAIAFFEGTKQAAEFEEAVPEIKELLTKANITVFRFEKTGEKAYKICRL